MRASSAGRFMRGTAIALLAAACAAAPALANDTSAELATGGLIFVQNDNVEMRSDDLYWEQTFPAKAETLIEHRYRPSVGGSVQTSLGAPASAKEAWYDDYKRKYCLDSDFFASIERLRKAAKSEFGPPYSEERIDYILRTGANWSGPIKQFHLTVDKGEAGNLVSFCGAGVKKTGDTKFEMSKTNFSPDGDLAVLILKKMPTK